MLAPSRALNGGSCLVEAVFDFLFPPPSNKILKAHIYKIFLSWHLPWISSSFCIMSNGGKYYFLHGEDQELERRDSLPPT